MTWIEALFLGILQGIAEFFPISSSGHLKLFQALLGHDHLEQLLLFDLICHLGTLLAILLLFSKSIRAFWSSRLEVQKILIALVPLFPLVFLMKPIKAVIASPEFLGIGFLATAAFLYLGERAARATELTKDIDSKRALWIGVAQALAVLPGISRSGSTIATSRILGTSYETGAYFSFMLAIPTILAGSAYELLKSFLEGGAEISLPWEVYLVGFLSSFFSGCLALSIWMRLIRQGKVKPFIWYCFLLGTFATIYFNLAI